MKASTASTRRRALFEDIFDALFCYGEEPRCWFSPALMATVIGCHKYDIEDAVAWLQAQGRIGARYDAEGDCYARVIGPVPLNTAGRRELDNLNHAITAATVTNKEILT